MDSEVSEQARWQRSERVLSARPQDTGRLQLELPSQAHHESVRKRAKDDRAVARMREISWRRTQSQAGHHVGLPMGLDLHPGDRIVGRQQQERVDGRIVMRVFEYNRRRDRGYSRHLAARKAV